MFALTKILRVMESPQSGALLILSSFVEDVKDEKGDILFRKGDVFQTISRPGSKKSNRAIAKVGGEAQVKLGFSRTGRPFIEYFT